MNVWRALHRPRVYLTVEPVLFLFMFAQFLSYSVFQQLISHIICERTPNCTAEARNETLNESSSCPVPSDVERRVQSDTSHWILYTNIAVGGPSILFALFYGSVSDILGRKLFILLPTLGAIVNTAVILVGGYLQTLPLSFFLIGAFITGICGSYSVINFAVYSYASDVSAHSGRTRQIGMLESMTYIGATCGPLIGGVWLKRTDSFVAPYWCVLAAQIAVIVYVFTLLPESLNFHSSSHKKSQALHVQQQQQNYQKRSSRRLFKTVLKSLVEYFHLFFTNWKLSLLMGIFFIIEINFLGIIDIVILYTLGRPLCWSPDLIGYFLSLKVFLNGVASLVILPILLFLGFSDTLIVLVGLVAGAGSLVMMGLASKTWIMFLVPVVAAMRGCVVPCVRSMLSKVVPRDKQGVLFSGVSVVEAACTLVASVLYNALYPATSKISPGFCFFVMSAALIIPFILTVVLHVTTTYSGACGCPSKSGSHETKPLL